MTKPTAKQPHSQPWRVVRKNLEQFGVAIEKRRDWLLIRKLPDGRTLFHAVSAHKESQDFSRGKIATTLRKLGIDSEEYWSL